MCGRARLSSDVSEIKLVFSIPPERPAPNIAPSWNVAPTDPLPIVHYDAKEGTRDLEVMRWGLIPYWAKDIKIGFSTINARAEEVDTKPAFREAFQRRRCLVPVDNFYEWAKTAAGKQPYAKCGDSSGARAPSISTEWSVSPIDLSSGAAPVAAIPSSHPQARSRRGRDRSTFPAPVHRG
jgi:putative SOS response-associated peptidase YedK